MKFLKQLMESEITAFYWVPKDFRYMNGLKEAAEKHNVKLELKRTAEAHADGFDVHASGKDTDVAQFFLDGKLLASGTSDASALDFVRSNPPQK